MSCHFYLVFGLIGAIKTLLAEQCVFWGLSLLANSKDPVFPIFVCPEPGRCSLKIYWILSFTSCHRDKVLYLYVLRSIVRTVTPPLRYSRTCGSSVQMLSMSWDFCKNSVLASFKWKNSKSVELLSDRKTFTWVVSSSAAFLIKVGPSSYRGIRSIPCSVLL